MEGWANNDLTEIRTPSPRRPPPSGAMPGRMNARVFSGAVAPLRRRVNRLGRYPWGSTIRNVKSGSRSLESIIEETGLSPVKSADNYLYDTP